MKDYQHISFYQFLKLGREQAYSSSSFVKKTFYAIFGSLQINPRIRSARIISEIMNVELPNNATILDAGFGHGLGIFALSQQFPNWKIVGYEIDNKFFNKAQKINKELITDNIIITQKDLETIDDVNRFDLIYSCDVLEHIENDVKVLRNFRIALKPNGVLLLHLPLRYELCRRIFPSFKKYTTEDHVRDEYVPDEIKNKLEQNGFEVDFIRYGYGILKGELAFELNNLIRINKYFLILSQLMTFPMSILLGYLDIRYPPIMGNSLVIKARVSSKK